MFEKIIKSAKIYNEVSVTHNKFEKFRYYEIPVRYNDSIVFVTVNVGKGINDGKYHIYDITEPKERNTPNRINGFVRPVGNAVGKGVSNINIPNSSETVKDIFGFSIRKGARVNEDWLEELSIHDPSAEVDIDGNVTVYHRTNAENVSKIKNSGTMTAKEDALFFRRQTLSGSSPYINKKQ